MSKLTDSNALAAAQNGYFSWLTTRFRNIHLMEIGDDVDPVPLRKIFIPMRLGLEDLSEEAFKKLPAFLPKSLREDKEVEPELPGIDAFDLIAEQSFVMISGRPGSGKSTLVQRLILELCETRFPSRFSEQLSDFYVPIPIPIILREIPDITAFKTVDALLDNWWKRAAEDAEKKENTESLDRKRLHDLTSGRHKERRVVLLLFDGLDEVGGSRNRVHTLELALEAHRVGYRVVITGRPTGYRELPNGPHLDKLRLRHMMPFSWTQIETFIRKWYRLRAEWETTKAQGITEFLAALEDRNRPYFLNLARRPIFMALIALVHCSRNKMPKGRVELYSAIVDLYLERQERQRRRRFLADGKPLPSWDIGEKRLALGYLAWRSMERGGEDNPVGDLQRRQFLWRRSELEEELTRLFSGRQHGRFNSISVEQVSRLVDYFLFPAGLLVPPAAGQLQFAHLSFQEYLCAEFLYTRALVRDFVSFLKKQLYARLSEPGWNEVALLLLAIHAGKTVGSGQLTLMLALDFKVKEQAEFFVSALTAPELPFSDEERLELLPLALACALVHGRSDCAEKLGNFPIFQLPGEQLWMELLSCDDAEAIWRHLAECLEAHERSDEFQLIFRVLREGWDNPSELDEQLPAQLRQLERQTFALLDLVLGTHWHIDKDNPNPMAPDAQKILYQWLERQTDNLNSNLADLFWVKDQNSIPSRTGIGEQIDSLSTVIDGPVKQLSYYSISLELALLEGENMEPFFAKESSVATQLLLLSDDSTYLTAKVCRCFYNILNLSDLVAFRSSAFHWQVDRYLFRSQSLFRSRSLSESRSRFISRSRSLSLTRSQYLFPSLSPYQSRSLSRFLSQSLSQSLFASRTLYKDLVKKIAPDAALSIKIQSLFKLLDTEKVSGIPIGLFYLLFACSLKDAALDWFADLANDPKMAAVFGYKPRQPLPSKFGIFDEQGRPMLIQNRPSIEALLAWCDDNQRFLAWVEPAGIPSEQYPQILAELDLLRSKPWSPQAALRAVLEDWPENQPEIDCSLQTTLMNLEAALDVFLGEHDQA